MAKKSSGFGFGNLMKAASKALFKSAKRNAVRTIKSATAKPTEKSDKAGPTKKIGGTIVIDCEGEFLLEVAGTEHYQDTLAKVVGKQVVPDNGLFTLCQLVREPTNEFDPNAVRVMIKSKKVGYLPRHDAEDFEEILEENGVGRAKIFTHARLLRGADALLKVEIDWNDLFEVCSLDEYDSEAFVPMILEDTDDQRLTWLEQEK